MEIKEVKKVKLKFTINDVIDKLVPKELHYKYESININMHSGKKSISHIAKENNKEQFGLIIVLMDEEN